MPTLTAASVDDIPIYREGATDQESAARAEKDPLTFHLRAYRELGPIYRTMVGERMTVMLAGLDSNDFIWRNGPLWTYREIFAAFREELGDDHVTAIDGAHHRQKRTILKPAFDQAPAMRYLPQYNTIFSEEMKLTPAMGKVDLIHFWAKAILKAQSKTVAQVNLSEPVLERMLAFEKALLNGIRLGEKRISYYADADYQEMKRDVLTLMGEIIDERLAHPERCNDNFTMVMQARMREEGDALSRDNLIDDFYLILLAGVENTSKLMGATLLSIVQDPEWLAEIRAELDAWDGRDVMALSGMNKLKATIMEAQRLYPPIMFNVRQATQDFEYGGYTLPAGTTLFHMQTLCHYLDEVYSDGLSFKPRRFMEDGRFAAKTNGLFGGGVHVCLGRNHTLLQTPIAVAQMLKYYDIEPVEIVSTTGADLLPGAFLKELWVRVTPRK